MSDLLEKLDRDRRNLLETAERCERRAMYLSEHGEQGNEKWLYEAQALAAREQARQLTRSICDELEADIRRCR